jgi:hypothetical protein
MKSDIIIPKTRSAIMARLGDDTQCILISMVGRKVRVQ